MTETLVKVWAVVPAAGAGRRFRAVSGERNEAAGNKLLQPVDGRPMLAVVLDALDRSCVAGVVVVVSPAISEAIQDQRPPADTRVYVVNDREQSEMIASVQMGLASAASSRSAGYLVCPGDHPGVTTAAIDRCVAAFAEDPSRLIIATCNARRGHPIILPADLARAALDWPEDERLDALRTRYPERVCLVETGEPGILIDVNRPGDLDASDHAG